MQQSILTLAQAPGEIPELTPGQLLTAFVVMAAFGGSLMVYSLWAARWHKGQPVFRAAERKAHYVPKPLLLFGLLFMGLMVATSLLAGEEQASEMVELSRAQRADKENGADDEITAEENNTTEEKNTAEGRNTASEESDEVVDGTDNNEMSTDIATTGELTDDGKASNPDPESARRQLTSLMLDVIGFDAVMFLFFGGVLFAARQAYSRRVIDEFDVAFDGHASTELRPVVDEMFDGERLDEAPSSASYNPYAPDADDEDADKDDPPGSLRPFENWNAVEEIRFAAEAFLAAYLPTVLLRAALVLSQDEPQKHPLLEVIDNGVDLKIMSIVFGLAVVAAPIVEELVFRVVLCGGMLQRRMFWTGMVLSSVMFSLSHGYPDSIALLPLAFALAYVYHRRRSYRTVILVHFFFNAFNMLLALAQMVG